MMNLGICVKCSCREDVSSSVFDYKSGKVMSLPSVTCRVYGSTLLGDSEVPEDCPYYLEHMMTQEESFDMMCDLEETVKEDWGIRSNNES